MGNAKRVSMGFWGLILLVLLSMALPLAAVAQGTEPNGIVEPSGDWQPLHAGEGHWVGFYYMGDGSSIQVRLQVESQEGARFSVWTPEEIRDRGLGLEAEPVGRGSPDPTAEGRLLWSGSFNVEGIYQVLVERGISQPAGGQAGPSYYLLEIEGEGISFEVPARTPEPEPELKEAQPKPAVPAKPSGRLVFQTTFGGDFYTINIDGTGLRRITDGTDPIWSPDGRQIAFTRWREPRGVWVVNDDSSGERRVFDWNQARWPSWSPDSSELLFSRMTGKGRQEAVEFCFRGFCFTFPAHPHWRLGVVELDDGSFAEPPSSETSHAPMWSPDGELVVHDDLQGLRVQSLDGEVSYLITDDPRDTTPAWSPDGEQVAFTRRQHDHWEVYGADADGRNLRRLTDTPTKPEGRAGNSVAPAWSPDGGHIAFLTDRTGEWEIWIMRADGTQHKPMFKTALDGIRLEYGSEAARAISWTR